METTKRVYRKFFEITGIIIGLATLFITIIWAFAKGDTLGEVTGCVNFTCLLIFGTQVTLGIVIFSWVIISIVALIIDVFSLGVKTSVKKINERQELSKIMTLIDF